jgi:hypothetical protein
MAETSLSIQSYSVIKVRVEPTSIRGTGTSEYLRLAVPLNLSLSPIKEFRQIGSKEQGKPFVILDIKGSLFLQDSSQQIADSLPTTHIHRVFNAWDTSDELEFPLDYRRIEEIEEKRKGGDLMIRLDFRSIVGVYEPLILSEGGKQAKKNFLAEIETPFAQMSNIIIPQSHWVKNILPSLGRSKYILVEIPESNSTIKEVCDYLERAEVAFMKWDTKGVSSNCREIGSALDTRIKDKFGDGFTYKERWGRVYKGFSNWASLDLHLEDIKKSKYMADEVKTTKADAEHLLVVTKSLIKFAEELLRESER